MVSNVQGSEPSGRSLSMASSQDLTLTQVPAATRFSSSAPVSGSYSTIVVLGSTVGMTFSMNGAPRGSGADVVAP